MKALKILTGMFVILAQILSVTSPALAESRPMKKKQLLVTAYYSPLPDQSFYIKGTYAADIRLNGRGTNGADGTEVYIGMLAAPKTYAFGTRVRIPGLGVGEVHDRGGAILARKNYDRIDVWMGHGEEGLARALNWGARLVEGEVYYTAHQVQPGLDYSSISTQLPASMVARLQARTAANRGNAPVVASNPTPPPSNVAPAPVASTAPVQVEPVAINEVVSELEQKEIDRLERNRILLASGLGTDSEGDDVKNLQRMLWDLGYYKGELSGLYNSETMEAVYQFQLEHEVIHSESDLGAGYFGKKTLEALLSAIEHKIQVIAHYPKGVQTWVPEKKVLPQIAALKVPVITKERQGLHFAMELMNKNVVQSVKLSAELSLNDRNEQVVVLQNMLVQMGHLEASLNTGYYGGMTEAAVLKFQLEKGIVGSSDSLGAGRVGPKTLGALNSSN